MLSALQTPTDEAKRIAAQLRGKVVEMSHKAKTPHLGSSLSCCDIVVAAYWNVLRIDPGSPLHPNRDRFILSKGHAATTLYAALAMRGFFPIEILDEYNKDGGFLAEHPGPHCVPGVEAATGSLGHGLPIGLGMAMAAKIAETDYRVYVLMSDGECNEGSVWEAAMFAPAMKLDNVCVIVDYNKWQATARSNETLSLAPLADKFTAFGWTVYETDGHDIESLTKLMQPSREKIGRPVAIIAHTVKGRGVSFMEDDNNWHYRIPTADELTMARKELGLV
jgi:transketolase